MSDGPLGSLGTASRVIALLTERRRTVAVAESLTGGLLVSALIDVPDASAVVRGGVVAYMTDLKASLLGVDSTVLEREGPYSPEVAVAMALGVRDRLGADYGIATTGVAGPGPADGKTVGTVYLAVCGPDGAQRVLLHTFDAALGRDGIRRASVTAALDMLADLVGA